MSDDNAGNGLRGSRAAPTPRLLAFLRERYGLDDTGEARDLGGSSCLNLWVTAGGAPFVARVYRPYVGAARLEAIQTVRHALIQGGVPCPGVVPARDGEPWCAFEGR